MDMKTEYLGLELDHPVVVSACQPLSRDLEKLKQMEEDGAAAVVLHSLFEEQIVNESTALDHYLSYKEESFAEALTFFPEMSEYNLLPRQYLELIEEAKEELDIPLVGSLNGVSTGGWLEYAEKIESAGVDALELNIFYMPLETEMSGRELEEKYVAIVEEVNDRISIPLTVKIGPYFSSIPKMAEELVAAGAEGLTLFNRFYQPDFDIENLEVVSDLQLSRSYDMRLPLRWTALMHGKIETDFAITGGVHNHEDVIKAMMAGGKVTMLASELLENGSSRMKEITANMKQWLVKNNYDSVNQMQGSMSQQALDSTAAIERANYTRAIHSWSREPGGY